MKTFILAVFLILMTSIQAFALKDPVIDHLPNGLTVAWFDRDSIPVVDCVLVLRSGYRNDPQGKSGLTEFLVHLMEQGSGGFSREEFSRKVDSIGATRAITVDDDSLSFGMHGLATDTPELLNNLYALSLEPLLPEKLFQSERSKLLERISHMGDSAEGLAGFLYHRLTSLGTTYFRAGFGSEKEFSTIRYEDLLRHYKLISRPEKTILILTGRVNREQLLPLIQKKWSSWKANDGALPPAVKSNDKKLTLNSNTIAIIGRKDLTQGEVRVGFRFSKENWNERFPIAVWNALMGEYYNSRLNQVLRNQSGLTYSVSSSATFNAEYGRWTLSAATRNDQVPALFKKVDDLFKDLVMNGVSEQEVNDAKTFLVGSYPIGMSSLSAIASRWLIGQIYELNPTFYNGYLDGINQVTKAQVNAWVQSTFKSSAKIKVVAGDEIQITKALKKAGMNQIKVFKIKDLL